MSLIGLELSENSGNVIPFFILGDGDVGIGPVSAKHTDGKRYGGIKMAKLDKTYKLRDNVIAGSEIPEASIGIIFKTAEDYDNLIELLTELKEKYKTPE